MSPEAQVLSSHSVYPELQTTSHWELLHVADCMPGPSWQSLLQPPQLRGSSETFVRHGKAVLHVAQPVEQLHVPLLRHTPFSLHGVDAPPGHTPLQSVPKYPG